ncbi:MAG: 16S rRNA (guanine(966)-N(2))-methyltransferase RsmD [Planctomycetes bacterium]|nr:16S rRNA (guanine(966)-N(2))-methyltransferase RsmD [Planctomycetota bacterium]
MPRRPRPTRPPAGRRHAPGSPTDTDAASAPRIVGGSLRGRRLPHLPGGVTRPMKDRVRETLFDLLGTSVRGAVALDLFAGTGALGFEALSRGADRAIFAERHFPTAELLRQTARSLGVEDRCEIRPGDVLLWPKRMPDLPAAAPWLVFVSPPWAMFAEGHERHRDLLALVAAIQRAAPAGSTLVVEADTAFDPAHLPDAAGWESRAVPPAVLHILRPRPGRVPEPPASGIFAS